MFVNTLALRGRPEVGKSFKTFLGEVKTLTLESLEHQQFPFEDLVEALGLERDPSRNPLFDVLFQYLRGSGNSHRDHRASAFDLTLCVFGGKKRMVFDWEYRTRLFRETTIRRMASHFERLLDSVFQDPQSSLGNLEIVPDGERLRLQELSKAQADAKPRAASNLTLSQLFEAQVKKHPEASALVSKEECLTYRELNARANQLAWFLREIHDIGPECLVAVMFDRSIELVVALLGILKAGGAYTPIDPRHPEARIRELLQDSRATLALVGEGLDAPDFEGAVVRLDGSVPLDELPSSNPPSMSGPDSLAYVIYTSGSTGRPKGG